MQQTKYCNNVIDVIIRMPPDMKHTILANMNVKLYWWPLTFHAVVRQQIWGVVNVIVLIQASFAGP